VIPEPVVRLVVGTLFVVFLLGYFSGYLAGAAP
jgi:hypothetical protein